ncbi:D-alanine--D-alanine ligase [Candidatus Saccharibacteria bacterium]|nr:D-alanine--D-alanine ligase [Candidatus Saccharibacteria bacterium]MBI3337869.1 D-alanine--D-alanine ligase [Candidatus Saccharibacteria bacterium]
MKTIAVIFGGRSTEHDVSIVTALASIIKPLELTKQYKVEAVYVAKDGAWYWDEKLKDIDLYSSGGIQDFLHKSSPVSVQFDGGMTLVKSSGIAGRKTARKIDVVFPAMHGTYGEDGSLMGLLRMANVPFVGCDLDASVLAMDKVLAKQIVASKDIPVAKYEYLQREIFARNSSEVLRKLEKALTYPMFVKPAHLGSSIGITRVTGNQELRNAIEVASHYDEKVLIEEEISNLIEVTLPIMGNETLKPALLERPLTKPEDFFDFDTKYLQGGKGGKKGGSKGAQGYSELPAKLSDELYKKAENTGLSVYRALGCQGIARVDMLIDFKTEIVYFNEVNPLPGGLYAHNWRAAGVSNIELVQTLVRLAEERWQVVKQQNTIFSTNYLQQF